MAAITEDLHAATKFPSTSQVIKSVRG